MSADFREGTRIGAYVLDAYVGGGGFGAVWRGHVEGSDAPVAIKLLLGTTASQPNPMRAEIELLAGVASRRSQHVVKVLGGGSDPVPYIVMEFIDGADLDSQIRQKRHLSLEMTIDVGLAVSDALAALYQAGIIHRDIKPANVMIDKQGVIKLADFGIAKIVGYSSVTMAGQTVMTMAYAAPEVWNENGGFGRPSHRSDLYAMGILLYQCLTGTTPFSGNSAAMYRAHVEEEPDFTALPAETPPALRILIRRCLEKRQEHRPQDAAECLALLQRGQAELRIGNGEPANEPQRFGAWLKLTPHEHQPWAWRCRNEYSGAMATVELHFADRVDYGEKLATAIEANQRLSALGAERLLDSSRLLLFPEEEWLGAPEAEFQFWLAREDLPVAQAEPVTESQLRSAVPALQRLFEAAELDSVALDCRRENLTLSEAGSVYLRRPGLDAPAMEPEDAAMFWLRLLKLDDGARRLVNAAADFQDLVRMVDVRAGQETALAPLAEFSTLSTDAGGQATARGTDVVAPGKPSLKPAHAVLGGGALLVALLIIFVAKPFSSSPKPGPLDPQSPSAGADAAVDPALVGAWRVEATGVTDAVDGSTAAWSINLEPSANYTGQLMYSDSGSLTNDRGSLRLTPDKASAAGRFVTWTQTGDSAKGLVTALAPSSLWGFSLFNQPQSVVQLALTVEASWKRTSGDLGSTGLNGKWETEQKYGGITWELVFEVMPGGRYNFSGVYKDSGKLTGKQGMYRQASTSAGLTDGTYEVLDKNTILFKTAPTLAAPISGQATWKK